MRRFFIAACCALLLPAGVVALSQGTTADPLSGKWGMDGLPYLDLQYDGKSSVSGTTIWRHDGQEQQRAAIATGTFDKDTGALKLTGELRNDKGEVVRYLIEGTVEKDVVAGTYRVGEQKGDFRFVRQ